MHALKDAGGASDQAQVTDSDRQTHSPDVKIRTITPISTVDSGEEEENDVDSRKECDFEVLAAVVTVALVG